MSRALPLSTHQRNSSQLFLSLSSCSLSLCSEREDFLFTNRKKERKKERKKLRFGDGLRCLVGLLLLLPLRLGLGHGLGDTESETRQQHSHYQSTSAPSPPDTIMIVSSSSSSSILVPMLTPNSASHDNNDEDDDDHGGTSKFGRNSHSNKISSSSSSSMSGPACVYMKEHPKKLTESLQVRTTILQLSKKSISYDNSMFVIFSCSGCKMAWSTWTSSLAATTGSGCTRRSWPPPAASSRSAKQKNNG